MNQIEFRISHSSAEGEPVVDVLIDGRSLVAVLREVEAPLAAATGTPEIAGGYQGLPAAYALREAPRHFLGDAGPLFAYDGKVSVLECSGCGMEGCWPFLVRIAVDAATVAWSEFEQPHRGPGSAGGHWSYALLAPFVFARAQYEAALADARAEARRLGSRAR